MYKDMLYPRITRPFHPSGGRFQCKFREQGQEGFAEDGAFTYLDTATSFTSFVVRFVDKVLEGQVLDKKTGETLFTCTFKADAPVAHRVREIPSEYAQLAMTGFDADLKQKDNTRRKKKADEVFSKLRMLHEELNQIYARPSERPVIHSPSDAADILQYFIGSTRPRRDVGGQSRHPQPGDEPDRPLQRQREPVPGAGLGSLPPGYRRQLPGPSRRSQSPERRPLPQPG